MYGDEFFIRKSPAILVIRIVTAEVITELMYSLFHFALYNYVGQTETNIAMLSGLLNIAMSVVAVCLFAIIVALWAAEGVLITKDELIYKYGVINERRRSYPYTNMQRIEVQQGILGKMLNFGTISVHLPVLSEDISFRDMSNPHDFADRLKGSIIKPSRQQYLIKR